MLPGRWVGAGGLCVVLFAVHSSVNVYDIHDAPRDAACIGV
jgi:hypothetical protein